MEDTTQSQFKIPHWTSHTTFPSKSNVRHHVIKEPLRTGAGPAHCLFAAMQTKSGQQRWTWVSLVSLPRVQLAAAAGAGALLAVLVLSWAGGAAPQLCQVTWDPTKLPVDEGRWAWNPMILPLDDKRWVQDWVRTEVPSMVKLPRRQLSMELGIGALLNNVPGDFVECGVALGGTSILLSKVLERYDTTGKRVLWAADSFEGLPAPSAKDQNGTGDTGRKGEFAYAQTLFSENLKAFGVDKHKVKIVKGWFDQTLHKAGIERISFLRLDGDLYVSTMAPLEALYDKLSPGGMVYVDDYNSFTGCKRAVDEFRAKRNVKSPLQVQYSADDVYNTSGAESRWEAAWWIKT